MSCKWCSAAAMISFKKDLILFINSVNGKITSVKRQRFSLKKNNKKTQDLRHEPDKQSMVYRARTKKKKHLKQEIDFKYYEQLD